MIILSIIKKITINNTHLQLYIIYIIVLGIIYVIKKFDSKNDS